MSVVQPPPLFKSRRRPCVCACVTMWSVCALTNHIVLALLALHEPLTTLSEWSWGVCACVTMWSVCALTNHSVLALHEPLTTLSDSSSWGVCACVTMLSVCAPANNSVLALLEPFTTLCDSSWSVCARVWRYGQCEPFTTLSKWWWSVCVCVEVCALTNHSVLALHVRFLCFIIARNFRINESNPNIYCLWVVSCSM